MGRALPWTADCLLRGEEVGVAGPLHREQQADTAAVPVNSSMGPLPCSREQA